LTRLITWWRGDIAGHETGEQPHEHSSAGQLEALESPGFSVIHCSAAKGYTQDRAMLQ